MRGQVVEVLEPSGRDARLEALLRQHHSSRSNRILVFVLYKKEAARVQAQLQRHGWKVWAAHLPGHFCSASQPLHAHLHMLHLYLSTSSSCTLSQLWSTDIRPPLAWLLLRCTPKGDLSLKAASVCESLCPDAFP